MPRRDLTADVSEWPLVSREECWRAYRPAQPFSESAFQRLRREAVLSPGVRLARRQGRRLSGQTRCFSRLNLLALEAYRTGDATTARRLSGLAAELERRDDVLKLVTELAGVWATTSREPRPSERWLVPESAYDLLRSVCSATDSLAFEPDSRPARIPAWVGNASGGMADLVLHAGGHIIFSVAKLSVIGCERPGSAVVLYLLDLGGTDELVRARPAVALSRKVESKQKPPPGPGAFDRIVTDIDGKDADLLDQLLGPPRSERRVDLTGLRIAP